MSDVDNDLPEQEEEEELESSDILEMSDEDFLKQDPASLLPAPTEEPANAEGGDEPLGEEAKPEAELGDEGDEEEKPQPEAKPTPDEDKPAETDPAKAEPEAAKPAVEAKPDEKAKADDKPAMDYEAEYKKLTAPFRANGKDMQVQTADEAIALMQMGANYNKKMAALKPNLKLLKLLENNGLLSEEKLSFLIDLDKKNPDAIQKLVKDSGLDPLEMDVSKSEYKPKTYTVDDRELELDAVLEKIQDTPTYNQVIGLVSNKWDGPSKQVVAENPQLLEVINTHMANGVYDLISTEVERQRVFGRLSGMSDIDAYRQVGEAMNASGSFNHLAQGQKKEEAPAQRLPIPTQAKAEDPAIRAKKLAASAPKAATPVKVDPDFNPLALSDDDFAKIGIPKFL